MKTSNTRRQSQVALTAWLACIAILLVLIGLWTAPGWFAYTQVSPSAINRLPQRMPLVKPGMTEGQVWQTLGIPRRCFLSMEGEGPLSGHWEGYHLPYGYHLLLVMDLTKKPPIFKHGSLTRSRWP